MSEKDRKILLTLAKVLQDSSITANKAISLIDYLGKLLQEVKKEHDGMAPKKDEILQ